MSRFRNYWSACITFLSRFFMTRDLATLNATYLWAYFRWRRSFQSAGRHRRSLWSWIVAIESRLRAPSHPMVSAPLEKLKKLFLLESFFSTSEHKLLLSVLKVKKTTCLTYTWLNIGKEKIFFIVQEFWFCFTKTRKKT